MVRLPAGRLLGVVALFIVTGSVVLAQPRGSIRPRVQIAIDLNRFGGENSGYWSDVEVEQPLNPLATGDLTFTELPLDVDLGTVELAAINGQPAPLALEQRFWPADDNPERHLQQHVGSQVTVTTTRGEVAGLLRAVDKDSLAIEVGAELRVLRRALYVQDVRFANSKWQRNSMVTWRLPTPALPSPTSTPSTMTVRYRTRSVTAGQIVSATIDEPTKTVDIAATITLYNKADFAFGSAQIILRSSTPDASIEPAVRLPEPVELPSRSSVTVPMMAPLRHIKTTRIAFADIGDRSRSVEGQPECSWNDPLHDGALANAIEFVTPPKLRLARAPVRLRTANLSANVAPEASTWIEIADGQGLIRLGPSAVTIEHQQLDCTIDQASQTVRETIGIELTNKASVPIVVVVNELLQRSSRWNLATSTPAATAHADGLRFRTLAPGRGKKKLTYTVVYAW